jgi:hypothetical protein
MPTALAPQSKYCDRTARADAKLEHDLAQTVSTMADPAAATKVDAARPVPYTSLRCQAEDISQVVQPFD